MVESEVEFDYSRGCNAYRVLEIVPWRNRTDRLNKFKGDLLVWLIGCGLANTTAYIS